MTMIGQGPFGGDKLLPPDGDGRRRGVDRLLTAAIYSSAGYSHVEPMPLALGMVVSCHPSYMEDGGLHWLCDTYLIGEETTERL